MIIVRSTMNVLPEKQKEVMQTLLSMIETAEKEKGCLSYKAFCDIESKTVLNLIEEWQTREDLERHIRSETFSVLLGTKSLLSKPLEIKIHTVSHSEGLEVVNIIRGKGTSKKNSKEKEESLYLGIINREFGKKAFQIFRNYSRN